jgi:hypothetical protein
MDASPRSSIPADKAVFAGMIIGTAITAFMMSPRMRRWFRDKYETMGGDETMNALRNHTREGVDAIKSSAKHIGDDLKQAKNRTSNPLRHEDLGSEP